MRIELTLNGEKKSFEADPLARLLDVIRTELGATGTKEGCGEGECGACTILIDGEPTNSCLVPAGQAHGREVVTVEGIARGDVLDSVQSALVEYGGTQCGICTPGIALTAVAALRRAPHATRAELRKELAGNLCRCTGYQRIIDAVAAAARPES